MNSKPIIQSQSQKHDQSQKVENKAPYDTDNGPLTDEQDRWIREKSTATNVSDDLFTERLF